MSGSVSRNWSTSAQRLFESLRQTLRPGDVINTGPNRAVKWYQNILSWGIQTHQKKMGYPVWHDTHTVLYFDYSHIFSVTYPKTEWETVMQLVDRAPMEKKIITVWRPRFELPDIYMRWVCESATHMIGTRYDVGQLLDIALNQLLRYDVASWKTVFDYGAWLKVCSVGVRACFDAGRKAYEVNGWKPPFDVLFTYQGSKLHVERTPPAAFANSNLFEKVLDSRDM